MARGTGLVLGISLALAALGLAIAWLGGSERAAPAARAEDAPARAARPTGDVSASGAPAGARTALTAEPPEAGTAREPSSEDDATAERIVLVHVASEEGEDVPGVMAYPTLQLVDGPSSLSRGRTETDERGLARLRLDGLPGGTEARFELRLDLRPPAPPQGRSDWLRCEWRGPLSSERVEVRLPRAGARLSGRIEVLGEAQPVLDGELALEWRTAGGVGGTCSTAVEAGRYATKADVAGTVTRATLDRWNHAPLELELAHELAPGIESTRDLLFEAGSTLELRFVDARTGAAIEGVRAKLWPGPREPATSDAFGRARIEGALPAGARVQLVADHPSYAPLEELLVGPNPPAALERVVSLEPGIAIEGTVIDERGTPLPRIEVACLLGEAAGGVTSWWFDRSAWSDSSGRFRVSGLPPVWPGLVVELRVGLARRQTEVVDLPAAAGRRTWVLLDPIAASGIVLASDGQPAAHTRVWAVSGGGSIAGGTDGEGRFRLEELWPGEWELGIAFEPHTDLAPWSQLFRVPFRVHSSGAEPLEVRLPPRPARPRDVRIELHVEDLAGRLVETVGYSLAGIDNTERRFVAPRWYDGGRFALLLREGTYDMGFRATGHLPHVERVVVDARRPSATLEVRLTPVR
jgi:hypothetical protein